MNTKKFDVITSLFFKKGLWDLIPSFGEGVQTSSRTHVRRRDKVDHTLHYTNAFCNLTLQMQSVCVGGNRKHEMAGAY